MCASACSDNREGEVITLRGPVSGGEIIRIAANADDGVLSTSQLLPKAMSDEVIFRDFCHSGNLLLSTIQRPAINRTSMLKNLINNYIMIYQTQKKRPEALFQQ